VRFEPGSRGEHPGVIGEVARDRNPDQAPRQVHIGALQRSVVVVVPLVIGLSLGNRIEEEDVGDSGECRIAAVKIVAGEQLLGAPIVADQADRRGDQVIQLEERALIAIG